ncbi:hypothetical protein FA95DRAFT_1541585 [Auriscalpium vulgare]|uniref:Uncharacterized protein n=1 Tax=Auriscalpium vulgare TaxID=40419 RepID=A0ACB8RUJ8_9AGAM|nr:hypothetical protein FA95DRAFT_1541585 [Auriscalpium vulgare]
MESSLPPSVVLHKLVLDAPIIMGQRYMSAFGLAVLFYDHALTFPAEVKLIWTRPVTLTKVIFVFVRYSIALCQVTAVYVLLIVRVYTLWDHRRAILRTITAAFCPMGSPLTTVQVAFHLFVILLTLLNAADRPRRVDTMLVMEFRRDGGLFYAVRS